MRALTFTLIFASLGHFTTGKPGWDMRARSITVRALTLTLTFASPAFSGGPYLQKTALFRHPNLSTKDLRDLLILVCYAVYGGCCCVEYFALFQIGCGDDRHTGRHCVLSVQPLYLNFNLCVFFGLSVWTYCSEHRLFVSLRVLLR